MDAGKDPRDEGRDPLAALRGAWEELRPPAPDAASEEAGERAALEWMRAAWDGLEAPPTLLPRELLRHRARRASWLLAASLAGLALAGWLALNGSLGRSAEAPEREVVRAEPEAPDARGAPAEAPALRVASIEPGRMELRSGPVRLILLDDWTQKPLGGANTR